MLPKFKDKVILILCSFFQKIKVEVMPYVSFFEVNSTLNSNTCQRHYNNRKPKTNISHEHRCRYTQQNTTMV
jgi:hypothetical protein